MSSTCCSFSDGGFEEAIEAALLEDEESTDEELECSIFAEALVVAEEEERTDETLEPLDCCSFTQMLKQSAPP